MSSIVQGRIDWSLSRDKEGHRTYKVKWLVRSGYTDDGPAHALIAAGLPAIGSSWNQGNDYDAWARCLPTMSCRSLTQNERGIWWEVEQTFSTKPLNRCQDTTIDNPLNEPDRISGGFAKYTKEVEKDKDGKAIKSSSLERIRGDQVTFDANRPTVTIEKNVLVLPLVEIAEMIDTVNESTLWGLDKRCVKLSNVSWSRELYGTCTFFYKVSYEFECRYDTFDNTIYDEGTKVLVKGGDKKNPDDFKLYEDINGNNTRVYLDGKGNVLEDIENPIEIDIQYYDESNFSTLGIPTDLTLA